ncbi:UNVERIFIED_ORG: hypothetical protein E4P37_08360 [Bacillus sp. AZ43]
MARTAAFVGAAAILALGGYAALPDEEPRYIGDMPSALQQPEPERPPAPRSDPGPAAGGPPPPVQGPSPVIPEAPSGTPAGPGERVPAPAGDTSLGYQPGSTAGDDSVPPGGVLDPVTGLLTGLVDAVGGLVDCVLELPTCLGSVVDGGTGAGEPTG